MMRRDCIVMNATREELFHCFVHIHPKRYDLIERRTRKCGPQVLFRWLLSNRVVVAIE